jgi:hypothetical protein
MNKQEIEGVIETLKGTKFVTCEAVKNAINMAISALTQQLNNGWIPVSERLPESKLSGLSDNMLITVSGKDWTTHVEIAMYYEPINTWYVGMKRRIEAENVIAWQPLPPEYRKDGVING